MGAPEAYRQYRLKRRYISLNPTQVKAASLDSLDDVRKLEVARHYRDMWTDILDGLRSRDRGRHEYVEKHQLLASFPGAVDEYSIGTLVEREEVICVDGSNIIVCEQTLRNPLIGYTVPEVLVPGYVASEMVQKAPGVQLVRCRSIPKGERRQVRKRLREEGFRRKTTFW